MNANQIIKNKTGFSLNDLKDVVVDTYGYGGIARLYMIALESLEASDKANKPYEAKYMEMALGLANH